MKYFSSSLSLIRKIEEKEKLVDCCFSLCGSFLISASSSSLSMYSALRGERVNTVHVSYDRVCSTGSSTVLCSMANGVKLLSYYDNTYIQSYHIRDVVSMSPSLSDDTVAVTTRDSIYTLDMRCGTPTGVFGASGLGFLGKRGSGNIPSPSECKAMGYSAKYLSNGLLALFNPIGVFIFDRRMFSGPLGSFPARKIFDVCINDKKLCLLSKNSLSLVDMVEMNSSTAISGDRQTFRLDMDVGEISPDGSTLVCAKNNCINIYNTNQTEKENEFRTVSRALRILVNPAYEQFVALSPSISFYQ